VGSSGCVRCGSLVVERLQQRRSSPSCRSRVRARRPLTLHEAIVPGRETRDDGWSIACDPGEAKAGPRIREACSCRRVPGGSLRTWPWASSGQAPSQESGIPDAGGHERAPPPATEMTNVPSRVRSRSSRPSRESSKRSPGRTRLTRKALRPSPSGPLPPPPRDLTPGARTRESAEGRLGRDNTRERSQGNRPPCRRRAVANARSTFAHPCEARGCGGISRASGGPHDRPRHREGNVWATCVPESRNDHRRGCAGSSGSITAHSSSEASPGDPVTGTLHVRRTTERSSAIETEVPSF
jgi:hypothetical protein